MLMVFRESMRPSSRLQRRCVVAVAWGMTSHVFAQKVLRLKGRLRLLRDLAVISTCLTNPAQLWRALAQGAVHRWAFYELIILIFLSSLPRRE